jgi:hypothetical protein
MARPVSFFLITPWGSPGVSPGGCQEDAGEQQGVIDEQNR